MPVVGQAELGDHADLHAPGLAELVGLWLIVVAGPVLRVWGHSDDARIGAAVLMGAAAVSVVIVGRVGSRLPGVMAALVVLLGSGALSSTWLGRAPTLVAGALLITGVGVLIEREPFPWWPQREHAIAVGPLLVVVAASVLWVRTGRLVLTAALLLLVAGLLALYQARPELPGPTEAGVRRALAAMARVVSRAAHSTASAWSATRGAARRGARTAADLFPLVGRENVGSRSGSRAHPPTWPIWAAMAGAVALLVPMFMRLVFHTDAMVMDTNDYAFHIRFAVEETSIIPPDVGAPHPLFHLGVALLLPLLGASWAAIAIVSAAVALTVIALVSAAARPTGAEPGFGPRGAALFALVWVVAESPSVLVQWLAGEDRPFAIVHFWGSPTEVVMVPFAILLTLLVGDLVERPDLYLERRDMRMGVVAVVVVTALAKPSLALVLGPAIVMLVVVSSQWRAARPRQLLRLVVLPSAVMAVGQTLFLALGPVPTGHSGFALRPLEVVGEVLSLAGWDFWILPVVMLVVSVALRRRLRRDPCFVVSVLALLVALPPMLLLQETGPRADDGALLKLGFAAVSLVSVFLLRACWHELRAALSRMPGASSIGSRSRGAVAASYVIILVVAGMTAYLEAIGVVALA